MKNHKKLKEELGLEFPILSDENLDFIRKTELKDPQQAKSLRGFVLLDKDGNILHQEVLDPFGNEADGIISFASQEVNK